MPVMTAIWSAALLRNQPATRIAAAEAANFSQRTDSGVEEVASSVWDAAAISASCPSVVGSRRMMSM